MSPTDHLDERTLDLYVIGDGDHGLRVATESHLATCDSCRVQERALKSLVSRARNEVATGPDRMLLDRIHRSLAINGTASQPLERVLSMPQPPRVETGRTERHAESGSWSTSRMRVAATVLIFLGATIGVAQAVRYVVQRNRAPSSAGPPAAAAPVDLQQPAVRQPDSAHLKFADAAGVAVDRSRLSVQQGVPVHDLGPILSTSTLTFRKFTQVVALGGGRVLVTDRRSSLVWMLDASLTRATVVRDSAGLMNSMFATSGYIAAFGRDSALIVTDTPSPGGVYVVTPEGSLGRTMPLPPHYRPAGAGQTLLVASPALGFYYRSGVGSGLPTGPDGKPVTPNAGPIIVVDGKRIDPPDTWVEAPAVMLHVSADMQRVDTAALIAGTSQWQILRPGFRTWVGLVSDFMFFNDVVATTDGSVAIFHARDYRIEWILPDGIRLPPTATPPLSYPWRPITEVMRAHLVDSMNAEHQRHYDSLMARRAADPAARTLRMQRPVTLTGQAVPDRFPPTFGFDQFLADADNNVWIRPLALRAPDGAWVWEIVNRTRGVVDRVRIPENKTIVGFGPGGIVYVVTFDQNSAEGKLQKVRVK